MAKSTQNSNQEGTSRWLLKWLWEAKWKYIVSSVFTLLSAGSFVVFSWYLSDFAATWLSENQILNHLLLCAFAFLTGRYVFAYLASLINYRAGNSIV